MNASLFTLRNTVFFVAALTVWRILLASTLQLHSDEAYYWTWTRHLDSGYYDHAPMVAYFIWLTTRLGDSEFWIRFSGVIVSIILDVCAWRLTMRLFNRQDIAAAAIFILNLLPLTMGGALVITPDTPSFLFWALAAATLWQLTATGRPWLWYALGTLLGLSMLSKYTGVLLAPCVLLYLLCANQKHWLKTPHPYLAGIPALLVFSPVIYWNMTNNWASFSFQIGHGLGGAGLSLLPVIEYIGGQLLIIGPLLLPLGIAATVRAFRGETSLRMLASLSLPVIAFFFLTSFRRVAGPNWPAVAYFTFSIIAAREWMLSQGRQRRLWTSAVLLSAFLSLIVSIHARVGLLPTSILPKQWTRTDTTKWFYGWRELAQRIRETGDYAFLISPSRQITSEMSYYMRDTTYCTADRYYKRMKINQFLFWPVPDSLRDRKGAYICGYPDDNGPYLAYFEQRGETNLLQNRIVITNTVPGKEIWSRMYQIIPLPNYK